MKIYKIKIYLNRFQKDKIIILNYIVTAKYIFIKIKVGENILATEIQCAPKTTIPIPQSSKNWFGLVKICIIK
jgi:hypothetical protein